LASPETAVTTSVSSVPDMLGSPLLPMIIRRIVSRQAWSGQTVPMCSERDVANPDDCFVGMAVGVLT